MYAVWFQKESVGVAEYEDLDKTFYHLTRPECLKNYLGRSKRDPKEQQEETSVVAVSGEAVMMVCRPRDHLQRPETHQHDDQGLHEEGEQVPGGPVVVTAQCREVMVKGAACWPT